MVRFVGAIETSRTQMDSPPSMGMTRTFGPLFAPVVVLWVVTTAPLSFYDVPTDSRVPGFVPAATKEVHPPGHGSNATRGSTVGIRSLSGASDEMAGALGRSRVTIRTPRGRYHVDLRGRAHFDKSLRQYVSTPHVRFDALHVSPSDPSLFNLVRGPVRPASWQDIRIVEKYLRRSGQL